jgi:hypothetical protein
MGTTKAVYLMARLTTKGIRPGMPIGGIPELTKTDIAAACSGLQSLHFHLVMAKYCDDVHGALQAMGELQELLANWNGFFADMCPMKRNAMAAAMIDEFVTSRRCGSCKGIGEKREESKIVECKVCQGSGKKQISVTARAKASGIPESTFRNHRLNEPFQEIMNHLIDIDNSSLERISRKAS